MRYTNSGADTEPRREMTSYLADAERRLLRYLAARLPRFITPNHLSGIGVAAAVGIGACYALSSYDVRWLGLASMMLVIHWAGDSLDGTLARVRHIERPRYGYYLDHAIDALSTVIVGTGIGLSPFVDLRVALLLVVVYLLLSVNVYLESNVFGVFRMAYGRFGPTEGRLLLIAANTVALFTGVGPQVHPITFAVTNTGVLVLGGTLVIILAVRFGKNLHRLDRMEPQRTTHRPVRRSTSLQQRPVI